jgi:hypothetical protein
LAPGLVHGQASTIRSPEQVLGLAVGADSVLADWTQITRYFSALAAESPSVSLDTIGTSTLGRPLLLATITAPDHQRRLAKIRGAQARLADPRRLTRAAEDSLVRHQPAVVFINNNLHSTEIASSQFSMLLAHRLVTDPMYQLLLEDVVVLLAPSANPDGLDAVTAWYRSHRGTPFEDGPLPWLYHEYVGHDNNRDWYMLTQVESRALARVLYREWFPAVVWDVHQMGRTGARFFLPPFSDPVNPNIDPLLVSATNLVGVAMAASIVDAGRTGVEHQRAFDLWWHGGFRTAPTRHNMIGILSEAASAKLASPVEIPAGRVRARDRGVMHPEPWPGGRWGLPEIIDYQMLAARGLLRLVADERETFVQRFVTLGRRAVAAGEAGDPFAYVIPPAQRDAHAVRTLVDLLRRGGVEVLQATAPFVGDGQHFPAGSVIIPMAQPFRAHAKDLLEIQRYPDRRLYDGGPPIPPYDVTGWTLPLQFGLDARLIAEPFTTSAEPIDEFVPVAGVLRGSGRQWVLRNRSLAESSVLVEALQMGARAWPLPQAMRIDGTVIEPGAVVLEEPVNVGLGAILSARARRDGFTVWATSGLPEPRRTIDAVPRIGLYRSWVANMDEGWTRWLLARHGIPFTSVTDSMIRAGDLRASFDVLVLPSQRAGDMRRGHPRGQVPDRYAGGLGTDGGKAIDGFIRAGGTVVALDAAGEYVIDLLELPISRSTGQRSGDGTQDHFYAPGTLFEVALQPGDPLTSGMDPTAVVYVRGSTVVTADAGVEILGRYAEDPLRSGYVLNATQLEDSAALIRATVGDGQVILFAFRPQHRAQTLGTLKLLFNALLLTASP